METGKLDISFRDRGPIDATEIGHFLFLFRGAYTAALTVVRDADSNQVLDQPDLFESRLKARLRGMNVSSIDDLFSRDLGNRALVPERIVRESPLEIIMIGVSAALVLAAILSGGKLKFDFKVMKIEADLPPIGEGIQRLRDALSKGPRAELGYGVRAKKIKLSKQEFDELMKHDPSTEKRGGFQRLLIGMQYRVNRTTRELILSDHEMDMILRHGRHPKKGGWQKSIKTIFGKHFDFGVS